MQASHLEVFVTVARTKSISRAARLLHLSQPAISAQVRSLEERFGLKLFERGSQGVDLTRAGQVVYQHAQEALDILADLDQQLTALKNEPAPTPLTIAAVSCLGNYALACSLWTFKAKYPQAIVRLEIVNTQEGWDRLLAGKVDAALLELAGGSLDQGLDQAGGLVLKDLAQESLVLITPNAAPWNSLARVSLKDLRQAPFILREPGSASRLALETALTRVGLGLEGLNVIAEVSSLDTVKSAVESGAGVALACRQAVWKEVRAGTLLCLELPDLDLTVRYCLAHRVQHGPDSLVSRFAEFLVRELTPGVDQAGPSAGLFSK